MTPKEEVILQMLAKGQYDGPVGEPYLDDRKYLIRHSVEHGIPCTYESAPIWLRKQGKPISYGRERKVREYLTDEEKLLFFRKGGFRMNGYYAYSYSIDSPEKPFHLTEKEQCLLILLHITDENVGRIHREKYGHLVMYRVSDGIPTKYEGKPIRKKVDGRMQIVDYTGPDIVKEYCTEKEQLHFLKMFGHYMSDEEFQSYSRQSGRMVSFKDYPR